MGSSIVSVDPSIETNAIDRVRRIMSTPGNSRGGDE